MRKLFQRFSRRTWIIVGVVAVALCILVLVLRGRGNQSNNAFQTTPIERGNLTALVGATGSVRARQNAVLTWQTSGTVQSVNVRVGDHVESGEVLAELAFSSLSQNIILAEADLAAAQKALEDVKESDTARAQALRDLDKAEGTYKDAFNYRKELNGKITLKDVWIVNGVPHVREYKGYADAETIADADEKLALAEAQLGDARRAYERVKNGPDPADVAAAEARVAAAQSTLNMARIIAPFSGTVTQAEPSTGDQVSPGAVAFRVDDLSHLLVDVQVSEVDINSVALGQTVTLTFDAILGKDYHGEVVEVGQAGETLQGVVNFTVTVELTDADEMVKSGMTAGVSIVVKEMKDVVLVPNRAVRLVDGERVVYVLKENMPVKLKVRLGQSSDTMSVVVGGDLKEGDQVILNPPLEFQGGGGPFGG
jgi:HlyD family secretion protein